MFLIRLNYRLYNRLFKLLISLGFIRRVRLIRLLPMLLMLSRCVTFWLRCNRRLRRVNARCGLPVNNGLLQIGISREYRRRRRDSFYWRGINLRCCGCNRSGGNRCRDRLAI
ncbi:hypothetical protein D3C78_1030540 [compost metagenome]